MTIFLKMIKKYKDDFDLTTMFGIPISELDSESLRACICMLGEKELEDREDRIRERKFLQSI